MGYHEIAKRLYDDPNTVRGEQNRYWKWIESYVAEDYIEAVKTARNGIEKLAREAGLREVEEGVRAFRQGCRMEVAFWEMGLRRQL